MNPFSARDLDFLQDLSSNNNREWFADNKDWYNRSYQQFKALSNDISEAFERIDNIEDVKVFRIYRDVRFSKDKSPYKTNFAAGFTRATKYRRGGYYLHISPGASMIGGGFWKPESQDLKYIREGIIEEEATYRAILASQELTEYFGEIKGDRLKSAPRGYDKEHPAIDLLRQKQFIFSKSFTDIEVTSDNFIDRIIDGYRRLLPFFDLMSNFLVYDGNGEER